MKDKEILKIIKSDIEKETPNILNKIDLSSIKIEEEIVSEKRKFNIFFSLSLITTALIIGFFVGLLIFKPNTEIKNPINISVTKKDEIVVDYTIGGIQLASSNSNKISLSSIKVDDIDSFHKYINIIEDYMSLSTNTIKITKNHGDNFNYMYKMEVSNTNVFGVATSYVLYYNEKRETEDDEEEKEMKGIVIYNNTIYNFYSEEEIEKDESEIKVTIYQDIKSNKIVINKELEEDEYSFSYKLYIANKLVTKIELKAEEDEVKFSINEDKLKTEYTLEVIDKLNYQIHLDRKMFLLKLDLENKKYIYLLNNIEIIK